MVLRCVCCTEPTHADKRPDVDMKCRAIALHMQCQYCVKLTLRRMVCRLGCSRSRLACGASSICTAPCTQHWVSPVRSCHMPVVFLVALPLFFDGKNTPLCALLIHFCFTFDVNPTLRAYPQAHMTGQVGWS